MDDKGLLSTKNSGQGYLYPKYKEPVKCPVCGSDDINAGHFDTEHIIAWREVTCEKCGFEWRENFTFVDWEAV